MRRYFELADENDIKLLDSGAVDLSGCDFSGLQREDRSYSGRDFSGANFDDASFVNCDLSDCEFDEASLSKTQFLGSSFKGSSLGRTNCVRTDFDETILDRASVTGVYSHVSFKKAQLFGTNFKGATFLESVNFEGAIIDDATVFDDVRLPRSDARQKVFNDYEYVRQRLQRKEKNDLTSDSNEVGNRLGEGLPASGLSNNTSEPVDRNVLDRGFRMDGSSRMDGQESSLENAGQPGGERSEILPDDIANNATATSAFADGSFADDAFAAAEKTAVRQTPIPSAAPGAPSEKIQKVISNEPNGVRLMAVSLQNLIRQYVEDPPRPNDPTSQWYVDEAVDLLHQILAGLQEIEASIKTAQTNDDANALQHASDNVQSLNILMQKWINGHGIRYVDGTVTTAIGLPLPGGPG